jgi:transposase
MPAKYVRPYSKGQKNDFRDAEAIAEAVQRPTMKFVATKTADQLDLQALHRVELVNIVGRTQLFNPGDLDNVKKIQAGYRVQP